MKKVLLNCVEINAHARIVSTRIYVFETFVRVSFKVFKYMFQNFKIQIQMQILKIVFKYG